MATEPENDWIELSLEQPPSPSPLLLVTNNIRARNAFGFMSHVWLVSMIHKQADGEFKAFKEDGYAMVHNLSHWRYAVPSEATQQVSL